MENNKTKMKPITLKNITLQDAFWSPRVKLVRDEIIPYQWDALNDRIEGAEPSHTISNFEIAAGRKEGSHYGWVFQDSDLYKWIESVALTLSVERDEKWENIIDDVVQLLEQAQEEGGYLNSYFTVKHPDWKWTNLKDDHELYCAGHLIEAAVAYYEATGKKKIIKLVSRLVDHIRTVIGSEEGKLKGYPGHPEIELALIKLYHVTKEEKHLELCKFLIEERGKDNPHFYDVERDARDGRDRWGNTNYEYFQAHLPIREQKTAEGHSVRAIYLYSGIVDLAVELQDEKLLDVCRELWRNIVDKRMYITGGVGSSAQQERFTVDYDLPNDRAYAETCAAISLVFFAHRMLQVDADGQYAEVMERALYNGVLSGMSLDGKSYFYVNPLEVWPHTANHRSDMTTIKTTRQPWFGCACCPPNIARLLASFGKYIYSYNQNELYVHLFVGSQTTIELAGQSVTVNQESTVPWGDSSTFTITSDEASTFTLAVRVPQWSKETTFSVNGTKVDCQIEKGYAKIEREWNPGDKLTVDFDMSVQSIYAHPEVRENAGKVALQRGPLVYCLEEQDNGENLQDIVLSRDSEMTADFNKELLNGITVLTAQGYQTDTNKINDQLYVTAPYEKVKKEIHAIPYYAWSNRGEGEMTVWIRED